MPFYGLNKAPEATIVVYMLLHTVIKVVTQKHGVEKKENGRFRVKD